MSSTRTEQLGTDRMRDSSQLTLLSTLRKQPCPANWIPLILSLISLLRVATFFLINLTHEWSYVSKSTKISKKKKKKKKETLSRQ